MEVLDMIDQDLATITIDRYTDLQRIKKENGSQVNRELDCQIKVITAKLTSLGVHIEDITL